MSGPRGSQVPTGAGTAPPRPTKGIRQLSSGRSERTKSPEKVAKTQIFIPKLMRKKKKKNGCEVGLVNLHFQINKTCT